MLQFIPTPTGLIAQSPPGLRLELLPKFYRVIGTECPPGKLRWGDAIQGVTNGLSEPGHLSIEGYFKGWLLDPLYANQILSRNLFPTVFTQAVESFPLTHAITGISNFVSSTLSSRVNGYIMSFGRTLGCRLFIPLAGQRPLIEEIHTLAVMHFESLLLGRPQNEPVQEAREFVADLCRLNGLDCKLVPYKETGDQLDILGFL